MDNFSENLYIYLYKNTKPDRKMFSSRLFDKMRRTVS